MVTDDSDNYFSIVEDQLAPNPGLEEGTTSPTSWWYYPYSDPNINFSWATDQKHDGNKSVNIVATGVVNTFLSRWLTTNDIIPGSPGQYSIHAWIKTNNVTASAYFRVLCFDGIPGTSGLSPIGYINTPIVTGTQDWTYVEYNNGIAPEGTTYFRLECVLYGSGTVWFDDVSFTIPSSGTTIEEVLTISSATALEAAYIENQVYENELILDGQSALTSTISGNFATTGYGAVLTNEGVNRLLNGIFNNKWAIGGRNFTVKLYTNERTPSKSDTRDLYDIASGGGYVDKVLTMGGWVVNNGPNNTRYVEYPVLEWTFSGPLTCSSTVDGYIVVDADGVLLWAERLITPIVPGVTHSLVTLLINFKFSM